MGVFFVKKMWGVLFVKKWKMGFFVKSDPFLNAGCISIFYFTFYLLGGAYASNGWTTGIALALVGIPAYLDGLYFREGPGATRVFNSC